MKVFVQLGKCLGYANCVTEAPEIFDLDETADKVVLLTEEPDELFAEEVRAAVRNCPAKAISVDE